MDRIGKLAIRVDAVIAILGNHPFHEDRLIECLRTDAGDVILALERLRNQGVIEKTKNGVWRRAFKHTYTSESLQSQILAESFG